MRQVQPQAMAAWFTCYLNLNSCRSALARLWRVASACSWSAPNSGLPPSARGVQGRQRHCRCLGATFPKLLHSADVIALLLNGEPDLLLTPTAFFSCAICQTHRPRELEHPSVDLKIALVVDIDVEHRCPRPVTLWPRYPEGQLWRRSSGRFSC